MGSKMTDSFEERLQKLTKELHSKATPAEAHFGEKITAEVLPHLVQAQSAHSCELGTDFIGKVFQILRLAFHSDQKKVQIAGLAVLQKLLEDDRFSPKHLTGDCRQAFPEMFVNVLAELCLEGSDEIVVDILRLTLTFACQPLWMKDPYALMKIVMFCMQLCGLRQSVNVKTAASATNVQAISSFCKAVLIRDTISADDVLPSEFQTVLSFFGDNLENLSNFTSDTKGIEVLRTTLLSVFAVMQNTPKTIQHHPQFQEYIWQKVTPALCNWLGTPAEMYMECMGRQMQASLGPTDAANLVDMELAEIKLISQIFLHLVRIYSRTDSMRCVLGSLLQRMLSVASVRQRLYTLNSLIELLDSPVLIAELEGPNVDQFMPDTCIIELVSQALANMAKLKHPEVEKICTRLALAFLTSLEHIAEGTDLAKDQIDTLNRYFVRLKDTTPLTFDQIEQQLEDLRLQKSLSKEDSNEQSDVLSTETPFSDTGDLPPVRETSRQKLDSIDSELGEDFNEIVESDAISVSETVSAEKKLEFQCSFESSSAPRTDADELDSARRFVRALVHALPELINKISSVEADGALQLFASKFCEDEKDYSNDIAFLNADGVYVAAYQTIRFVLRAREKRFYTRRTERLPMSQKEFVSGVLGCGLLIHMSQHWILEVFRIVRERDLMLDAGIAFGAAESPLTQIVRDIEGIGRDHPYLHDCMRLEACAKRTMSPEKEAGNRLARYLLSRCWNGIEQALQCVFLGVLSRRKLLSAKVAYTEDVLQLMCSSLGGLQRYADLCSRLYLYELCNGAYALLARICCSSLYPQPSLQSSSKPTQLRLHPWIVMSMDVILRRCLDMGSRNADCWKAFFTCYLYLHRLETRYLVNSKSASLTQRELKDCSTTIAEIAGQCATKTDGKVTEPLDPDHSYVALGALLGLLESCFVDAVNKLNLSNLCNFVRAMGDAGMRVESEKLMLLERLTNVVISSSKCGRPLLHIMIIWASAIPFLYSAAAGGNRQVSEKAVSYIHSIVASLTSSQTELPNFHFNELQLKPFESLICSQVCSIEVQELIVYSLCNLVETSKADIRSGWKSLFGTLRGIQLDSKSGNLLQAVGDAYEAYLNSNNAAVFASSLWECLQSLTKMYRSSLDISNNGSLVPSGHLALKYIKHSAQLLFPLHRRADFTGLHQCNRLRSMCTVPSQLDPVLPNCATVESLEEHFLEQIFSWLPSETDRLQLRSMFLLQDWRPQSDLEEIRAELLTIDAGKGVLMAVYNVLDVLIGGLLSSWNAMNVEAIECIMDIFRGALDMHCVDFTVSSMSALLLPAMQQLLRRKNGRRDGPFQQLIGLFADLLGDLCLLVPKDAGKHDVAVDRFVNSSFAVLAECVSCGHESSVKLSTSCIRHLTGKLSVIDDDSLRIVLCRNLVKLLHVTFASTFDLMSCYNRQSKSIYGDTAHIKIAITTESSFNEMQRLRRNAFRVFLANSQAYDEHLPPIDPENRCAGNSFAFLIFPSELDYHTNACNFVKRLPLDQVTYDVTAHGQLVDIVRGFLSSLDDARCALLSTHQRLLMLCALRQVHMLTSDFNQLSGLRFLLKRVIASPRTVSLYGLQESTSALHSQLLLKAVHTECYRSGIRLLFHSGIEVQESPPSGAGFEDYLQTWCNFILLEYIAFIQPDAPDLIEKPKAVNLADILTTQSQSDGSDGAQQTRRETVMEDVALTASTLRRSSLTEVAAGIKKLVSWEMFERLMEAFNVRQEQHAGSGESAERSSTTGSGIRKNPFRETVTPSTELPHDVAMELKCAMEEDQQLRRLALLRPLVTLLSRDGFSAGENVGLIPVRVFVAVSVLQHELLADSELWNICRTSLLAMRNHLYDQ